ncbi:MAG: metabolite traffic protein EboE, partial [Kiloniellales bacterium]
MQLMPVPELGHLTYCTNIHAGETWPEVLSSLRRHLPPIKAEVAPGQRLGVGLRLSAIAAEALDGTEAFAELGRLLQEGGYYVFTINGFPYGRFHGQPVKEGAYRPDWSTKERLDYTNRLADLLAALLPDGLVGSVSTVPGTFKPWADGRVEAIVDNLIRHVAHLLALEERSGRTIVLALEPEPHCLLETIEETIRFFEQRCFAGPTVGRLADLSGLTKAAAADALRRHLGVCYDVCHAAVEFEDPRTSIAGLKAAGIGIAKLQLSCALKVPRVDARSRERLGAFDEPVYLHQVVARQDGRLSRFLDLPDALAAAADQETAEWRIHFHVPI